MDFDLIPAEFHEIFKKANELIERGKNMMEENVYLRVHQPRRIAVNVKLGMFPITDIDELYELIDQTDSFTPENREQLKANEEINNDWIQRNIDMYLEYECDYYIDDYIGGEVAINSDQWNREAIEKETNPDIKLKLEEQRKEENKIRNYVREIQGHVEIAGRSGGWLCIYPESQLETMVIELEDELEICYGDSINDEALNLAQTDLENFMENLKETLDALDFHIKEITNIKNHLPEATKEELIFRLTEELEV